MIGDAGAAMAGVRTDDRRGVSRRRAGIRRGEEPPHRPTSIDDWSPSMRTMVRSVVVSAVMSVILALWPGAANAAVSGPPPATPQLATSGTDGSVEQVRQIAQCGTTMYAVGRFSAVKNGGTTAVIARNNAFAFSAVAPYRVTAFDPNVNGQVNTIACGTDGSVLLGGNFTTAGGAANRNIAKVNATTGASMPFSYHPFAEVFGMEIVQGHLLVGGAFAGFLDSRNPVTGADDGYGTPAISGTYVFPGVKSHRTQIYKIVPNPAGTAVLLTGVFTSVGGQHHEQIVRLNLGATATVSAWSPTELYTHCATAQPFYAQDAAWSPDGSSIYTATTGFKPFDQPATGPRTGPCDAAIAWPAEPQVEFDGHTWINYTGCDSLYSVAADADTVFIGGHQRWISNSNECDRNNTAPGRPQSGLGHLSAASGADVPGPNRGRGLGAADLLRTPAGLWIASDNQANTNTCAGVSGRMGICFLPAA
jgi:hypothetical protein